MDKIFVFAMAHRLLYKIIMNAYFYIYKYWKIVKLLPYVTISNNNNSFKQMNMFVYNSFDFSIMNAGCGNQFKIPGVDEQKKTTEQMKN